MSLELLDFAGSNNQVEAISDDVHQTVVEIELELDLWVVRHEAGQRGDEHAASEYRRHTDLESAPWDGASLADGVFGLAHVI